MATLDQTTNSIAVDGNVLLINTNTNRVGINQSTPSVALHVVGSTTIDSGNLTLSTGNLIITSGSGTIGGQAILVAQFLPAKRAFRRQPEGARFVSEIDLSLLLFLIGIFKLEVSISIVDQFALRFVAAQPCNRDTREKAA